MTADMQTFLSQITLQLGHEIELIFAHLTYIGDSCCLPDFPLRKQFMKQRRLTSVILVV